MITLTSLSFRIPLPHSQQCLHTHRELSIRRLPVMNRPCFHQPVNQSRRDAGQRGRMFRRDHDRVTRSALPAQRRKRPARRAYDQSLVDFDPLLPSSSSSHAPSPIRKECLKVPGTFRHPLIQEPAILVIDIADHSNFERSRCQVNNHHGFGHTACPREPACASDEPERGFINSRYTSRSGWIQYAVKLD